MQNDEKRIAVFIDFENVAMGVRESNYGDFAIDLVLKRIIEKGKILVKRAYSDWHRYAEFKRAFHQAAIELIDVPQTRYSGKNSADIRMVVDALDLSYQKEHIDTFVLVSGDSDFSPLVSKLRENGRYVIGIGVKQSSSDLLVNNCDEFIYYEDLVRPTSSSTTEEPKLKHLPHKRAEALRLALETFQALQREGKEVIYGSMVKQTLLRKLPSFNESYYGYPMFSRLLEDAEENKLLRLTKDLKSGGYVVTSMGEPPAPSASAAASINGDLVGEGGGTVESTAPETGQVTVPAAAEPRERGRRSRWGRGRTGREPRRFAELPIPSRETPAASVSTPAEPVVPHQQAEVVAAAGSDAEAHDHLPNLPMTDKPQTEEKPSVEAALPASQEKKTGLPVGRRGSHSRWDHGRKRGQRSFPQAQRKPAQPTGAAPVPSLGASEEPGTAAQSTPIPESPILQTRQPAGIERQANREDDKTAIAPIIERAVPATEGASGVQKASVTKTERKSRPAPTGRNSPSPARNSARKSSQSKQPTGKKTPKK